MEASQRLRIVSKYTVGVDDIDVEAATELGIMVCHAPTEANCFGVAEQTIAMMLAILKKVRERDAEVRAGKWREPHLATTYVGRRLSDGYPASPSASSGSAASARGSPTCWRPGACASSPMTPMSSRRASYHGVERVDYDTLLRSPTWCRSTSCSRARPATCSPTAARADEADRDRDQHRARQGGGRGGARARARGRAPAGRRDRRLRGGAAADGFAVAQARRQGVVLAALPPHSTKAASSAPASNGRRARCLRRSDGQVPDNVYNKDVIPRWKERFGGASVTG